jgi:ribosomal protein S18 acetylase RimI-like enzyme
LDIAIHEASSEDCEAAYPLICELANGGWTGSGEGYKPSFENYAKAYTLVLDDKRKKYYVAKIGEDSAGLVGITINQSLVEAGNFAVIEELVVSERYRRKGVGQRLLDACIAFAKEQECQSIVLTTGFERLAAHKLYEKNGFEKVGVKFVIDFV